MPKQSCQLDVPKEVKEKHFEQEYLDAFMLAAEVLLS